MLKMPRASSAWNGLMMYMCSVALFAASILIPLPAIFSSARAKPSGLRVNCAALASAGIVAGVVLALVGGRFLRSLLYEVSPTSLRELAAAVLLLVAVTLLAALAPALRAARTDPAVVLRGE